jgi:hypothetical protein
MHIFRKPSLRKRALITIGTTGFIQCSGYDYRHFNDSRSRANKISVFWWSTIMVPYSPTFNALEMTSNHQRNKADG